MGPLKFRKYSLPHLWWNFHVTSVHVKVPKSKETGLKT